MPTGPADPACRRAGVCLHLTSLPGPRGIGDIGAAAFDFLDWMAAHGLRVWQFLPTAPTGFGNSPYQALSVFAGNPLLIDIDALADWGFLRREEIAALPQSSAGTVDYRVAAAKQALLERAADRFRSMQDLQLESDYEAFCRANDDIWLDDYATYSLLKIRYRQSAWTDWDIAPRDRESAAAELRRAELACWERTKRIQYFFARQWRAFRSEANRRGIELMGDVPIYMALDSADAWAHPDLLLLDDRYRPIDVAGVPPDYFSSDGQLWGNPVYRWDRHAADGYAWWIARLSHALAFDDIVRLDHFRGFDEFWSIPRGARTARDGRWQAGPGRAFFDAVCGAFGSAAFVAEDLGQITESVIALRRAYALPGMKVLQFLVTRDDFDLDEIDGDCVCYTGTHDNDTTEGWFAGSAGTIGGSELERLRAAVCRNVEGAADSAHRAMISICFDSDARIAIAPLQDYLGLGSEARLNTPGSSRGNWIWRVREAQLDGADCSYIGDWVTTTGRSR